MTHTRRPVLLAVGGDSGTGKTTITRGLVQLFGAENTVNICLDDYHKLDRKGRAAAGVTALNPAANNIDLLEEQVWALREGQTILKPVYDHSTGTFGEPEVVEPKPWIIIRGLFPLFTPRLREAFDLRVWLDPDTELKYFWKVQRDVAQRGYTVEQVIRHIVDRQDDLRRYILPQQEYADLIIRFHPPAGYFQAMRDGHQNGAQGSLHARLTLKPSVPAPEMLDTLRAAVSAMGENPWVRFCNETCDGQRTSILELDAALPPDQAAPLADLLFEGLDRFNVRRDTLGTFLAGGKTPRQSQSLMLTQLLIASQLAAAAGEAASAARRAVGQG